MPDGSTSTTVKTTSGGNVGEDLGIDGGEEWPSTGETVEPFGGAVSESDDDGNTGTWELVDEKKPWGGESTGTSGGWGNEPETPEPTAPCASLNLPKGPQNTREREAFAA